VNCPECYAGFNHVRVLESRPQPNYIRRRRFCDKCQHRWTTIEMVPINGTLQGSAWVHSSLERRYALMPVHEIETMRSTIDLAFKRLLAVSQTIESICDLDK
jgi:hypothetical protein